MNERIERESLRDAIDQWERSTDDDERSGLVIEIQDLTDAVPGLRAEARAAGVPGIDPRRD